MTLNKTRLLKLFGDRVAGSTSITTIQSKSNTNNYNYKTSLSVPDAGTEEYTARGESGAATVCSQPAVSGNLASGKTNLSRKVKLAGKAMPDGKASQPNKATQPMKARQTAKQPIKSSQATKPSELRKTKKRKIVEEIENPTDVIGGIESEEFGSHSGSRSTEASKVTSKQRKQGEMKERLESARFRYLNEMLYTSHSKEAVRRFSSDPSSFEVYHQGYRHQIEKWPVKPIDLAIQFVKSRPKSDKIADLGCGEAKLSSVVPQTVYSYDIKALNDRVTIADMSNLPLKDGSVNVVIFCLSLMGTNISDFISEAHRILIDGGVVWVAETVISRLTVAPPIYSDIVSPSTHPEGDDTLIQLILKAIPSYKPQ